MRSIGISAVILVCGALLTCSAVYSESEPAPTPPPAPTKDEVLRKNIQRGLDYLANIQNKTTGMIGEREKLATTSLAGMAFLSGGNLPGRGLYGKNVELAVRFIVDACFAPTGYLQYETSNMYSHGFAAMFLAETFGSIPPYMKLQPKVMKVLKKAIELIQKCQSPEGGWWYNPQKNNSGQGADISVTVCETNALRAARNCGVAVDKRVIEKAIQCVKNGQDKASGGFNYRVYIDRPPQGGPMVPRSAGAVCVLQALGAYDDPATAQGLKYLVDKTKNGYDDVSWWFYATYYLSQAMFVAGETYWAEWWPKVRQSLLSKQQQSNGSWNGEGGIGYGTAVALIVLQMPYRYLPLYQEGIEKAPPEPKG
jgi:hypothetical protein